MNALPLPPSRSALIERLYASAHAALASGDDEAALRGFAALTFAAPRDERGWLGLGVCHERSGELHAAVALYGLGAGLVPTSPWLEVGRGRALHRLGRAAEAQRAFDLAESITEGAEALASLRRHLEQLA
jgi:predicted TPR repeat methyltransferase